MLHEVIAAVGFGLVIATVLSVAALGFDLTFAVSQTLNIGFIAFMLLGQVAAYEFEHVTSELGSWASWPALRQGFSRSLSITG